MGAVAGFPSQRVGCVIFVTVFVIAELVGIWIWVDFNSDQLGRSASFVSSTVQTGIKISRLIS